MIKNQKRPTKNILEEKQKISPSKKKSKQIKLLVIFIVLVLILDGISLYWFFKPEFSFYEKTETDTDNDQDGKCKDGTFQDSCSKNKPLYCYNRELLKKAFTCGCPEGYSIDFQNCKKN